MNVTVYWKEPVGGHTSQVFRGYAAVEFNHRALILSGGRHEARTTIPMANIAYWRESRNP